MNFLFKLKKQDGMNRLTERREERRTREKDNKTTLNTLLKKTTKNLLLNKNKTTNKRIRGLIKYRICFS